MRLGRRVVRASYVTGETVATAIDAIARWRHAGIEEIADVATLTAWMERNRADIDTNPSAFAAIEIALLDLFARQAGQTHRAIRSRR